jgi:cytochrome c oxidase assembly protein subunit 15
VTELAPARGARLRARALSPAAVRWAAYAALVALFLVTVSGATVRLTGSGLGCENWPRCGEGFLPEQGFHSYVEFGNRVVGFLVGLTTLGAAAAAWLARAPRGVLLLAASLPLLVLAQGILGGITVVFELHPLIVMGHFLLALIGVGLGVALVLAVEAWTRRVHVTAGPAQRWLGLLALALLPVAAVLVVTGAFVTAAGPHSGGADIERLGNLEDTIYVHVRAAAVFGVAFLVLVAILLRRRGRAVLESRVALAVLALLVVQMVIGEVQWRRQLPWGLVLAHVAIATAVWAGVVALAALLRPRAGPPPPVRP